ncbi:hypothetical protein [Luteibacter sp. 3190]|uniref:hypothetical protein n=1 Tax=Luteibacter sp. 3190 TaxID=2817736 RepID=UPI00285746BD|nr:hypothetical protein [Luteibacter sp. 3190]MDR6938269.1 hypothetical protein [Luteibacter sp. 3190]
MMTNRAVQRTLLQLMAEGLRPFGFKRVLSQQVFRRKTARGWIGLHLAFINHDSDFDVTLDAGVRFDAVQDALLGIDRESKQSATVGCEYGRFTGQGQFRWSVRQVGDLDGVVEGLLVASATTMIPFLGRYSDMPRTLEALARDDETSRLLSPIDEHRKRIIEFMRTC